VSQFKIPIIGRRLRATGDILLRAELDLLLKTNAQTWEQVVFRFDSATEMTTMPAAQAKLLDIALPINPIPGLQHAQNGLEIRAGVIRAQVAGMDSTEYVFPCYFLGDPNKPVGRAQAVMVPRNLLGLSGVVDKVRLTLDGKSAGASAPYGYLVVEKQ
jgi:hypothetical protein